MSKGSLKILHNATRGPDGGEIFVQRSNGGNLHVVNKTGLPLLFSAMITADGSDIFMDIELEKPPCFQQPEQVGRITEVGRDSFTVSLDAREPEADAPAVVHPAASSPSIGIPP